MVFAGVVSALETSDVAVMGASMGIMDDSREWTPECVCYLGESYISFQKLVYSWALYFKQSKKKQNKTQPNKQKKHTNKQKGLIKIVRPKGVTNIQWLFAEAFGQGAKLLGKSPNLGPMQTWLYEYGAEYGAWFLKACPPRSGELCFCRGQFGYL